MFHIYEGFHLVDAYHKMRHQRKYHPEDSTKRVIKIALVALVTLVLWNMPAEWYGIQNLTVIQQRIIAIFAFATLMWILEIVSSWATSVAIIVLMLLFCTDSGILPMVNEAEVGKLLSYKGVMATFADPVIMLFIGGFVLAIAATKTGLDAQLAKVLLKPFGTRSEMVLLGFLLITGLFSMFVSNTATAAMMLTFLTPVFHQLPPQGKGRISLAMSIPVAANLGGMGTPIGTPPNTIALKYLNDPEGLNLGLGFGQWMMFMFPLVLILLFISWRILLSTFPFTQKRIELKIDESTTQYIYWDDSSLLTKLRYVPYAQFALILIFITISVFVMTTAQRSEQNRLWVGLSKETAHQLGTPISSLNAWQQLLADQYPNDEYVPQMKRDIDRLQMIADRFQKIGSEPALQAENIIPVLQNAVAYMRARISNRVTIDDSCLSGVERVVMLNAPLLQWVVENLLKNAVDAISGNGSIVFQLHENEHDVMIDIADTGKGIDAKTQRRIFEPGFTSKERGWGLGLPLAKRIVEQYHGGKLLLKSSQTGVGTTFRIVLKKPENG